MTTVPVHDPGPRAAAKLTVAVPGDRCVAAQLAVRLLREAGITVDPRPQPATLPLPDRPAIRLLIVDGEAAERVERIRDAAVGGAPVVAAMPDDAGLGVLQRALRAGANGILFDGELVRTLLPTLFAVWAGQLAVPPGLRRRLAPQHLSYREKQILSLVVRGYTNRQIADELILAESTIKTHLSSAFAKLEARSRAEAAALILDPDEGYDFGMAPVIPDLPGALQPAT